jgi:type IV secretion system protein VirB9
MKWLAALTMSLFAISALAQTEPVPGPGDPRFQIVDYAPNQVIALRAAPGYQVTVQLAADERIESIAVGDSSAWQVTANRSGESLFVKLLQPDVSTNMTVITSARLYVFDLQPLSRPTHDMPYSVQFRYPSQAQEQEGAETAAKGRYMLSGTRALRPDGISDDGLHTYIEWPKNVALPAVYALDDLGGETLVNGMVRDGIFVIDAIAPALIFRIDRRTARATRIIDAGQK